MKILNLSFTAVFLLFFNLTVYAQTLPYELTILNPQKQWQKQKGTIEEATVSIQPKGMYAECGLYLTLSDKTVSSNFSDDSLEVILSLKLPEGSIIHNSWLWIGDDIAVGKILDRWTAVQTYEGIVNRKSDPSILYTDPGTPNGYKIRIYPLIKNQTRKIKITYLVSMQRSKGVYSAAIPSNILLSSKVTCPELNVLVWPDGEWDNLISPTVNEEPFQEITNINSGGEVWRAKLTPAKYNQTNTVDFPPLLQNGVYLNMLQEVGSDEGIYQLIVNPALFSPELPRTRLVVVFDYQNQLNEPTLNTWLLNTKKYLKSTLSSTDSFNLVFSGLVAHVHSNHWIPADDASIDQVFANLPTQQTNYSQFVQLTSAALDFIKSSYGSYGEVMILSNTVPFYNVNAANSFVDDVRDFIGNDKIGIFGLSLLKSSTTNSGFFLNNNYYHSTTYPLTLLSALTGGSHYALYGTNYSMEQAFDLGFGSVGPRIKNFELYTTLENGICYSRFGVNNSNNIALQLNKHYGQVGKFKGNGYFKFTMTGEINDQIVSLTGTINPVNAIQGDTLNREAWAGLYINAMENLQYNSSIPPQIISTSISERVLSKYTAFLCLEDSSTYCDECFDESQFATDTKDALSDSLVLVRPNPFTSLVTIQVSGIPARAGKTNIEVFDLNGRIVQVLNTQTNGDTVLAEWNGLNYSGQEVASGVYMAVISNQIMQKTIKLVKTD